MGHDKPSICNSNCSNRQTADLEDMVQWSLLVHSMPETLRQIEHSVQLLLGEHTHTEHVMALQVVRGRGRGGRFLGCRGQVQLHHHVRVDLCGREGSSNLSH